MASRLVARSRDLALALSRAQPAAAAGAPRALSSLPRCPAAAPSSPGLGKALEYQPTSHLHGAQFLPRWFSNVASNGSPMQKETCKSVAGMEHSDALKVMEGTSPKVVAFSPVEAAITKPRSSPLTVESSKVKRSELATLVTFYMIPSLLIASKNGLATSILVGAVFHQIYMFHKEIFLDYVHHDITRKWVLIYFKLLLLIMAKETIVYFNFI
ncbi:succinate dehydrogenase subunit 4, mitochondrial-like isoform X2 [Oryza brachyantha]|uniref:succinate dehydrogenase subunit 4, mitochondrial-like isoform X2 n=1 Tax=Oryza brachyantha TaxID=4533 RepID=UPI001AD9D90F|nr:succinate dehydrogenase subunit 4, mitochondrial-like isoform X2 [Oryza brachyantha]